MKYDALSIDIQLTEFSEWFAALILRIFAVQED